MNDNKERDEILGSTEQDWGQRNSREEKNRFYIKFSGSVLYEY